MSVQKRALIAAGLYFCFGAMERATWPNLLPTMGERFGVSSIVVAWTIIAFALGMAGSTLTAGRLGDLIGHRRLAVSGFAAEGVILGMVALSPVLWPIFVLRFFQGFAAAAALNNITAIVFGAFPRERRGRVIGFVSGLASIGLLLGPVYGGFVAQALDWRWAIGGIAAYTLAQAVVTFVLIAQDEARASGSGIRSLNWAGAAGLLVVMVSLIVAAQLLRFEASRPIGAALLVGSVIMALLTLRSERRSAMPILGLHLFKSWSFTSAGAATIWFSLAFGVVNLLFPFYLQQGLGWTIAVSGVMLVALNVVQPWGSPLSGILADRIGAAPVMIAGAAVGVVALVLAAMLGPDPATWQVALPLVVFGFSMSLFMPSATKLIYSDVPQTALASAASMATSGRYIGQSLGAALGTALLAAQGDAGVAEGFGSAMGVTAALLFAGMAALGLIRPLLIAVRRRQSVRDA